MSADRSLTTLTPRITVFGCGNMASAMLRRWLACGLDPALVTAIRRSDAPVAPGIDTRATADGLPPPNILLIGIKPQQYRDLLPAICPLAGPHTLVVSILAGIPLVTLAADFAGTAGVVRAMPNLPVETGHGIVAVAQRGGSTALDALLATLGLVFPVADEAQFDHVTALAGCGPAFVYRFVDALAAAAATLGIAPADADRLARAMTAGAALTVQASAASPAALADAVASPGGMTRAGLDILDADDRLKRLVQDTLAAAVARGAELAR
jgi:pyrroline-5-carboxylate reductase